MNMKTKLATIIFSAAAAVGSAVELPTLQMNTTPVSKQSFGYVRLGVGDKEATEKVETVPGLGLGYRYGMKNSALDLSANYTSQVVNKKINDTYFYTAPRLSYLRYVSEDAQPESFYYGAGLAWGGLKKEAEAESFEGIMANATVGYEMNRTADWHSFVQLDVSQPAVKTLASWDSPLSFKDLPRPVAEFSVGFGY